MTATDCHNVLLIWCILIIPVTKLGGKGVSMHMIINMKNLCFIFLLDGDLGAYGDAEKALMKQKHRLIWERRHGPVGSGMKSSSEE